jgi:transcriptional regulator with XRE-family HTH domain
MTASIANRFVAPITGAAAIGRSLRPWRALRQVKQSHAAELLGVSQATISRWENGSLLPLPDQERRLRQLMSARADAAADHELARLVTGAVEPMHLVCDLTHRLLAASPGRTREWGTSAGALLGVSLWRYATDEIREAERGLPERGWYEPAPPTVLVSTRANRSRMVPIRASRFRWIRFPLSDGSHARLVRAA